MDNQPVLSGLAFAALRADNTEILNGVDAEDAVNSCWKVLQLSISWFSREAGPGAKLNLVVPEILEGDLWIESWSYLALCDAMRTDGVPPEFPLERLEHIILVLLMQINSVMGEIAELKGTSTEAVLEELHGSYLTYLAII